MYTLGSAGCSWASKDTLHLIDCSTKWVWTVKQHFSIFKNLKVAGLALGRIYNMSICQISELNNLVDKILHGHVIGYHG
jgi:hypothetical protein